MEYTEQANLLSAKSGDILSTSDNIVFLFKGLTESGGILYHAALATQGSYGSDVHIAGPDSHLYSQDVFHVSDENRDIFMEQLEKAGYRWDESRNELVVI